MTFQQIRKSERIGIFTHVNPDGDALGSSLGLMGWLDGIGKDSRLYLPTEPGESLKFMIPQKYENRITIWDEKSDRAIADEVSGCDLLIGLDFNTLERIGPFGAPFASSAAFKILVDHHISPQTEAFDDVTSCTEVSSTCELLYSILLSMPGIDRNAANLSEITRKSLLTGMTTDTNNFANSVFPKTLVMVSELIAAGTDRDAIIQQLYFRYPERRLRAEGFVLSKLMTVTDNGVGFIVLSKRTLNRFNLQEGDTEGFVNLPLSLASVRMSILLREERNSRKVRVSIRSKKGTSARECAMKYFHGGGHELAAGGKLTLGEDLAGIGDAEAYIRKHTDEFFNDAKN